MRQLFYALPHAVKNELVRVAGMNEERSQDWRLREARNISGHDDRRAKQAPGGVTRRSLSITRVKCKQRTRQDRMLNWKRQHSSQIEGCTGKGVDGSKRRRH